MAAGEGSLEERQGVKLMMLASATTVGLDYASQTDVLVEVVLCWAKMLDLV